MRRIGRSKTLIAKFRGYDKVTNKHYIWTRWLVVRYTGRWKLWYFKNEV